MDENGADENGTDENGADPALRFETIHATAVAVAGRGLLIVGPSGAGKSTLALQMIALGACLIADDRVALEPGDGALIGHAPGAIADRIEVRGIGLLATPTRPAPVLALVDLGQTETARLPEPRTRIVAGRPLPCLHRVEGPHLAAALVLYLRGQAWPG